MSSAAASVHPPSARTWCATCSRSFTGLACPTCGWMLAEVRTALHTRRVAGHRRVAKAAAWVGGFQAALLVALAIFSFGWALTHPEHCGKPQGGWALDLCGLETGIEVALGIMALVLAATVCAAAWAALVFETGGFWSLQVLGLAVGVGAFRLFESVASDNQGPELSHGVLFVLFLALAAAGLAFVGLAGWWVAAGRQKLSQS